MEFPDSANRYLVGRAADRIALLDPPVRGQSMSRSEALLLAAWLVVLVDPVEGDFERALDAVLAT
jgi:hypothetical protein